MNIWFRFLELNFSMVLNEPGYTHGPSRVLVVMDKCHPGRTELSCLILSTVSRPIPWVMSLLPYAISRVCNSSPSSSSPPASSSSSSNHFWIAIIATIFHRHGNHGTPIFHGKIHYKWPFSIAMLVHQRVTNYNHFSFPLISQTVSTTPLNTEFSPLLPRKPMGFDERHAQFLIRQAGINRKAMAMIFTIKYGAFVCVTRRKA